VIGFENVNKGSLIEWPRSDLFEPVLQHVTDGADIVTGNTMKQRGSKEQENKEEENKEHDSHSVAVHYVDTLLKCW